MWSARRVDHPASIGQSVVSTSSFPVAVLFPDRNYRYKSVPTQIPDGPAEVAPLLETTELLIT